MKLDIFSIPFYQYEVSDWDNKKKKLLELFDNLEKRLNINVVTSSIDDIKTNILDNEINCFKQEIGIDFYCENFWFQKYHKGMNHDVHSHGFNGFSSVCFVKYSKDEHESPVFVSPFLPSTKSAVAESLYSPNVKEGDIIFFPRNLMHYVPVNHSDKERIVVSFNLTVCNDSNENNLISKRFSYY